jgi:ubiquinone/menaquinone biosynthesis C-methylase UbiE
VTEQNAMPSSYARLREWFGEIDIYLFDQLLKGRLTEGMTVLDAGMGGGRNLIYLMRSSVNVFGIDESAEAVEAVRRLADKVAPHLPASNFRRERVEAMSFDDASFDWVISSAVLHFARDEDHFQKMLREMWRVLKPGGIFFARLASTIGIETSVRPLGNRRFHLPDGSVRFLVDEEMLTSAMTELGGSQLEPIKTVNVQNLRCMTTWCLRKTKDA